MAITFKRIFHPVGQGAFFTEQFFNEGSEKAIYNVVYDCGSFTYGTLRTPSEILIKAIDSVFNTQFPIDLLFISHFDGDHINGINYLIDKEYVSHKTIVIIPFKYAKTLCVLKDGDNVYSQIALVVERLIEKNIHIVGIEDDDYLFKREELIYCESLSNMNMIPNGARLVLPLGQGQTKWFYIPFLVKRRRSLFLDRFRDILESKNYTTDQLSDSAFIRNHLEDIRDSSQHSRSGSQINMHSLQVLSYCSKNNTEEYSCLYTGDTSLANRIYYEKEMEFATHWINQIGMMQIPHHGSIKDYPCLISLDDEVIRAFVNYQPNYRQKIFDDKIPKYFKKVSKELIRITDKLNSMYNISMSIS